MTYRTPTDRERWFLRLVTCGHSELERHVESCELSAYDPTGYDNVRVLDGPPSPQPAYDPIDGPSVTDDSKALHLEVLLWTDDRGLLYSIEVLELHGSAVEGDDDGIDPVEVVVDAAEATPWRLRYPTER